MQPQVIVTRHEWGTQAFCSCGWSISVRETELDASARVMALVDAHLKAHRRRK